VPEQLTFPFELRVGDVILEDGYLRKVVTPPTAELAGKATRAWVRAEGDTVQHSAASEAWRKLRVTRRRAA
jgi:hypothetical protein